MYVFFVDYIIPYILEQFNYWNKSKNFACTDQFMFLDIITFM